MNGAWRGRIPTSPSNAGATNLLALILSESSNPAQQEKALRYAQMNAQRFANNSQANITLAWILSKLNRPAESDAFLQKAVQAGNLGLSGAAGWLRSDGIDSFGGRGERDGFETRTATLKGVLTPLPSLELGLVGHWIEDGLRAGNQEAFPSRDEARREVLEYILVGFYNPTRLHSSLG